MSALHVVTATGTCAACGRTLEPGQLEVTRPGRRPICLTCHHREERA